MGGRVSQRSINSVRIIANYGRSLGVPMDALLRSSNIRESWLEHSEIQIDSAQELKVLDNLLSLKGNAFKLGMELGSLYQLTSYGIWGYALLASPSLRKAIDLGLRYLDLTYAFCDIHLEKVDQEARIVFEPKVSGPLADFVLYRDLFAMMVVQKDLFAGAFPEFKVGFASDEPAQSSSLPIQDFKQRYGGDLCFQQEANFVSFSADFLDVALPRGNEITARICEQQCCDLLNAKQVLAGIADRVRQVMLRQGLNTSMERVADEMAMTSRTLHRKLSDEGTSWRNVRDDVRCGMAEELLATQNMQLLEVAERLGFNDAANFSHSFKRWRGVSPSQYRAHLKLADNN